MYSRENSDAFKPDNYKKPEIVITNWENTGIIMEKVSIVEMHWVLFQVGTQLMQYL